MRPEARDGFAEKWAEAEGLLGRSNFHRLFDHIKEIEAAVEPAVEARSLLEHFLTKVNIGV